MVLINESAKNSELKTNETKQHGPAQVSPVLLYTVVILMSLAVGVIIWMSTDIPKHPGTASIESSSLLEIQTLQDRLKSLTDRIDVLENQQNENSFGCNHKMYKLQNQLTQMMDLHIEKYHENNSHHPSSLPMLKRHLTSSAVNTVHASDYHEIENNEFHPKTQQRQTQTLPILPSIFSIAESESDVLSDMSRCAQLPILSPIDPFDNFTFDAKLDQKLTLFRALSDVESLNDYHSPQYKAACFLLFEDTEDSDATVIENQVLMERYAFLVFWHTLHPNSKTDSNQVQLDLDLDLDLGTSPCDLDYIVCNEQQHIIQIKYTHQNATCHIPAELGHLQSLEILDLSFNQFSGTIPTALGRLHHLRHLDFNSNQLTGTIPSQIGFLTKLQMLNVMKNQLSGSIPSTLGQLGDLTQLLSNNNKLVGTIPLELFNCARLEILDLSVNHLSGTISSDISQLMNLKRCEYQLILFVLGCNVFTAAIYLHLHVVFY